MFLIVVTDNACNCVTELLGQPVLPLELPWLRRISSKQPSFPRIFATIITLAFIVNPSSSGFDVTNLSVQLWRLNFCMLSTKIWCQNISPRCSCHTPRLARQKQVFGLWIPIIVLLWFPPVFPVLHPHNLGTILKLVEMFSERFVWWKISWLSSVVDTFYRLPLGNLSTFVLFNVCTFQRLHFLTIALFNDTIVKLLNLVTI